MSRWSTPDFLAALAHATAGQLKGEMESQQRRQQQMEAGLLQQMNLAKLMQSEQERADANVRAVVPHLESGQPQADALGSLFNRPSAFAGLAANPLVQQRPELAAMLPPTPTPRGLPGGMAGIGAGQAIPRSAQPPLGERQFRGPGGTPLTVRGITKEQMAQRGKEVDAQRKLLQNLVTSARDPNTKLAVGGLLQSAAAFNLTTPEGYEAAGQWLGRAAPFGVLGGQQAQSLSAGERDDRVNAYKEAHKNLQKASPTAVMGLLDQMESLEKWGAEQGDLNVIPPTLAPFADDVALMRQQRKDGDMAGAARTAARIRDQIRDEVDPREESTRMNSLIAYATKLPAHQASDPKFMRQVYARFGFGRLVEGLADDQIPFLGGARADERLHQAIQKMSTPAFALLGWAAQKPLLDEMAGLSKLLRMPMRIPEKVIANLTPYQIQYLRLLGAKFTYQKTRDRAKDAKDQKEEEGKLLQTEREALRKMDSDLSAARAALGAHVGRFKLSPAEIDPNDPKDEIESDYLRMQEDVDRLESARDDLYRGFNIRTPEVPPGTAPKVERKPVVAPPKQPTLLEQGAKAVTGAVQRMTGQTPAQPRQRLNNQQRLDLVKILVGRGKSRAEAERIASQYR